MSRLEEITHRLGELAAALRDPETGDEKAAELAREAGELAAEAGAEVNRRLTEAAGAEPDDG